MYSLKNLFRQHPTVIAEVLRNVLGVLVILGLVQLDTEHLAAIALAVSAVLSLFVYGTVTPTANLPEDQDQDPEAA